MTDAELGAELYPAGTPEEQLRLATSLTPERRATLERMVDVGRELALYEVGLAPKPKGVIVCAPSRRRFGLGR